MADEPEVVEEIVTEQVTDTPVETPAETPHPLSPGGPRFEQVYAQMKEERDARIRAEAESAALRQRIQPQSPQPQYVDPNQLQVLIDQGRITPMQAADILSKQNAQAAAVQTTTQAVQLQALAQKLQSAKVEVDQYVSKDPTLRDTSSQNFQRVSEEAYRLSEDMGLPVTDLRVQRAALRATYGSLDRMASTQQARQQSRNDSLPHVETRAGGGGAPRGTAPSNDPLKDVDPTYIAFWERKGYSREQMLDEAQYIPKGRKVRTGSGARG